MIQDQQKIGTEHHHPKTLVKPPFTLKYVTWFKKVFLKSKKVSVLF